MEIKEKITISQFKKLLATKKNILVFGKSGWGKSESVYEYAKEHGLKVLTLSLAMSSPETIAGIPRVDEDGYYYLAPSAELKEFIEAKGEGWILFIDEINQGQPEVLNTLYSICHPDPAQRHWNGHDISKCQIVACGNFNNGDDGTVYLTELPDPLLNRFFVYNLSHSKSDARKYLLKKYKNLNKAEDYIKAMQEENIAPRDIDQVLEILAFDMSELLISAKIGTSLTAELLAIKDKPDPIVDPAETLKECRRLYARFKEEGRLQLSDNTEDGYVSDENKLLETFRAVLTEEEIASIVDDYKNNVSDK